MAWDKNFASAKCRTTYGRISKLFPYMDGNSFKDMMHYIEESINSKGKKALNELPFDGKFKNIMQVVHLVLPDDDSSLQWSEMGSGLTENPSEELDKIYQRFVLQHEKGNTIESRNDDDVWRKYNREIQQHEIDIQFSPHTIKTPDDEIEFKHTWKNGRYNCLQPLSFDLSQEDNIRNKAHLWLGQTTSIKDTPEDLFIYFLLGKPQNIGLTNAYYRAKKILEKCPIECEMVEEEQADDFARRFSNEINDYMKKIHKSE